MNKYLLFFLFCSFACNSQTIIKGTIYDSKKNTVPFISIILKQNEKIIGFTNTNEIGDYKLEIKENGRYILQVSSLNYEKKEVPIDVSNNDVIVQDITLIEKVHSLNEVIVQAERPIKISEDTIAIKTKYFKDGTEETVEDLLKKIPGLNIDGNGTITVGNQEIEKLMVEGDDFFEKGYKILSKNMPAYPIEEVEILKNYSNNRLLKGIEDGDKVALNLKLDEKSKRIWFGNAQIEYGIDSFYNIKTNLMNFGIKNKYYFLTNFNSIGFNSTGEIDNIIYDFNTGGVSTIGNNQNTSNLINLFGGISNFKRERSNFNNAEMVSLNAIFNPTNKLKIKTMGFFNWDETDFFRNSIDAVDANGTDFTNTENYVLNNNKSISFGKLDISYNISKNKMLEAKTKYKYGNFDDGSNLVFNGNSTIENLEHQNNFFDQKITYTNKLTDKKVLLLDGRFIDERSPQNYTINNFFYQNLFPESNQANNVSQLSENQMQYVGINTHFLDRKRKGHLLELQLGNEFRNDKLSTTFSLLEDENIIEQPLGYQNTTNYLVNDLYFKSKYSLKVSDFKLTGRLDFHQLFNQLDNNSITNSETPFYVNPSIGLFWSINNTNKITTSFSNNTTNARIIDVYSDFVLTGFRSFSKGTGDFNQLNASSFLLNYQLGNWSDRFFAETTVLYTENHDFFSSNTNVEQNYTQAEKILIKDRKFFNISSKLDYYLKSISSNIKLDLGFIQSDYRNIVNNSDFREVTSINYNYGVELRSGFRGFFNYHVGIKWMTSEIQTSNKNSFTDNISFLDLSFVFNKRFDIKVQSERYYFGNLQTDNTYYFLDFDIGYKLIENKLSFGLNGKNLFNTKTFRNFSVSDIGTSTTEYRLLPRFVLFKIEYRF